MSYLWILPDEGERSYIPTSCCFPSSFLKIPSAELCLGAMHHKQHSCESAWCIPCKECCWRKLFSVLYCYLPEEARRFFSELSAPERVFLQEDLFASEHKMLWSTWSRGRHISLIKDQLISIFGFAGQRVSVAATPPCRWSSHRPYVNNWTQLYSNKSSFTKPGFRPAPDADGHVVMFFFFFFFFF